MGEARTATFEERWLLDDPDNPRGAQPFEFPFDRGFPVRDALAGIALGDSGAKGSFHAGVVHALVMTGYYPRTVAGTSVGSIGATVLALAAESDDQAGRRAMVERYVRTWLDGDPGGAAWSALFGEGAPLRAMIDALVALPRSLDELAHIVRARSSVARAWWGARLLSRLSSKHRMALARSFARHAWRRLSRRVRAEVGDPGFRHGDETLGSVLFPEGAADVAQVALDAFGMRESLSQRTLDASPFAPWLRSSLPGDGELPMRALARSRLVFEAANVSSFDEGVRALQGMGWADRTPSPAALRLTSSLDSRAVATLRLGRSLRARSQVDSAWTHAQPIPFPGEPLRAPRIVVLDGEARLWPAVRAACAALPMFPPERVRSVFPLGETPAGCVPDDLLVDAGHVQHAPLTQVLSVWRREHKGDDPWTVPAHRLFVVYTGPRDVTAVHRGPDDPPPALFEAALRSLRLWGQEDLQFNARVVSLITQMIRAVRRAKKSPAPPPDDALRDRGGHPAVPVDCTTIAPDDLLPMEALSAPTRAEYARAMAQGCRATLEALHAVTLRELAGGDGASPVVERHGHVSSESVDRAADGGGGRVAELATRLTQRWRESAHLRALSPAALVGALMGDSDAPPWPAVADALGLSADRRAEVRDSLRAFLRGRFTDVVGLLDDRADAWGLALRGPDGGMPELLGLDRIEEKLRAMVFAADGAAVDLDAYARRAGTRFLFTVTDHDRGVLVHFGAGPHAVNDEPTAARWPLAMQAPLAASSFPLAFRLRTQRELFGVGRPEGSGVGSLYADGGILNNFPSDSAFAYLRALASRPGGEWISEHRHRVLLLSLTEPPRVPGGDPTDPSIVAVFRRARITAEADKVHRTLVTQQQINRVARYANPQLRREAREMRAAGHPESAVAEVRPAICADFIHIAPAQPGYAHAFAFSPALGFDLRLQNAAIAGGCRRARLALEWVRAPRGDDGCTLVTVEDFERRVRAQIEAEVQPQERRHCVLGTLNPTDQRRPCAFVDRPEGTAPDVYRACCDTALDDEPMRDLVGRYAEPG